MTSRAGMPLTRFVREVLRVQLTPGQLALALVGCDGLEPRELPGELRKLCRELFGKVDTIPARARAVFVVVAGARGGKSYLSALRLLHLALTVPLESVAAGEQASAIIVAPDTRLARQTLRFIQGALEASPSLRSAVIAQTADSVTIRRPQDGRDVVIEALPATRGGSALRGRTLVGALCDEACFLRDSDSVVNDVEIYRALSPRVVPGGQLLMVSTPWGESGFVYEAHRDNWGKPKTCLVAHAPTTTLRPDQAPNVERERERDPRNAEREFDAKFGSNDESLLDSADVQACVDVGRDSSTPERGSSYVMAFDFAARQDSFAWGRASRRVIERHDAPPLDQIVIEEVHEYRPKAFAGGRVDLDVVELDIASAAKASGSRVLHDIYQADAWVPRLKARGIRCSEISMASSDQQRRASFLATIVRKHLLRLPDHPELIKQLKNLRVTRHAGGRLTVAAPRGRGKHDDLADVVLLLIDAARTMQPSGGNYEIVQDGWERRFYRVERGIRLSVAPPTWAPEHARAQQERFSRGQYVQQDIDELGLPEIERRLFCAPPPPPFSLGINRR